MTVIETHEAHRTRLLNELPRTSAGYAAWVKALHELDAEILKLKIRALRELATAQRENGVSL